MTAAPRTFRPAVAAPIRERVVDAAIHLTTTSGWNSVTMGRLADLVGVSRQTVYTEVGTKAELAQAVVQAELVRFLAAVEESAAPHDDLAAALRAAVRSVLDRARDNPLLQAVVSASHGADTDLLPLLTVRAADLLQAASVVVDALVAQRAPDAPADRRAGVVDVVVRTVLSHLMTPGDRPDATADALAGIAAAALGPPLRPVR